MRVSEEIDALRTLGLDPYHFLVFPRVLALVLVVASVQLVTPTRRWRPRLPASLRGSARRSYP